MGAALRLRCENEFGFKMAKWIVAIELVDDFYGSQRRPRGYNENYDLFGYRMVAVAELSSSQLCKIASATTTTIVRKPSVPRMRVPSALANAFGALETP